MQIEKMDYEVSDRHRDSIKTELRPFVLYSGVDSDGILNYTWIILAPWPN